MADAISDQDPQLEIIEGQDGKWRVGWYFPDEGEFGAMIGEDLGILEQPEPGDKDDREHWVVTRAIKATDPERDDRGFFWESRMQALGASILGVAILKSDVRWPEWAIQAKAAGWTPPKGWKP